MLAQYRRHFDVILVERDDPVDFFATRQIRHGINHIRQFAEVRHQEDFINALARPRVVLELFFCQEYRARALSPAFTQQVVTFEIARHRQNGGHAQSAGLALREDRTIVTVAC